MRGEGAVTDEHSLGAVIWISGCWLEHRWNLCPSDVSSDNLISLAGVEANKILTNSLVNCVPDQDDFVQSAERKSITILQSS